MIYTAMCKQFKEQQFERFCKEQKRWFYAPYIGKHTGCRYQSTGTN